MINSLSHIIYILKKACTTPARPPLRSSDERRVSERPRETTRHLPENDPLPAVSGGCSTHKPSYSGHWCPSEMALQRVSCPPGDGGDTPSGLARERRLDAGHPAALAPVPSPTVLRARSPQLVLTGLGLCPATPGPTQQTRLCASWRRHGRTVMRRSRSGHGVAMRWSHGRHMVVM